jgi:hypothetical protein
MAMLATLALRGRVLVVDGGNCFDAYTLARTLRGHTHQVEAALKQVWLSRAFTCYQMVAMLAELPVDGTPVIVLDMLSTFLDENVNFNKRLRLLESSLNLLRRISQGAPVAVWARTRDKPTMKTSSSWRPCWRQHAISGNCRYRRRPNTNYRYSDQPQPDQDHTRRTLWDAHSLSHPTHASGRSRTSPLPPCPAPG